jgi:phage-related protein
MNDTPTTADREPNYGSAPSVGTGSGFDNEPATPAVDAPKDKSKKTGKKAASKSAAIEKNKKKAKGAKKAAKAVTKTATKEQKSAAKANSKVAKDLAKTDKYDQRMHDVSDVLNSIYDVVLETRTHKPENLKAFYNALKGIYKDFSFKVPKKAK